jgi:archaellum component FlaC
MKEILEMITEEYERASKKFPRFNSAHEGYAVLKEEIDELWDEIKKDQRPFEMREEAVQVAAMAIRFIIDVCRCNR